MRDIAGLLRFVVSSSALLFRLGECILMFKVCLKVRCLFLRLKSVRFTDVSSITAF